MSESLLKKSNQIRKTILEMVLKADSGHPNSSLSLVDILTVLKGKHLNWSIDQNRKNSDVFILSKGHGIPAWYSLLIVFGEIEESNLGKLRIINSPLQGHPDRVRCDWVDATTGALGQGLSIAIGRAEAKKLKEQNSFVYCILGDGEIQEGQIWEAAMYAGNQNLQNLIVILDYNKSQSEGLVEKTMPVEPLATKWKSFNWSVQEINGHNHEEIDHAIKNAQKESFSSIIIAHTTKGYLGPGQRFVKGAHSGSFQKSDFNESLQYLDKIIYD